MEKEKILQQLEEKLLPSVQNLATQQATEHDFLPALLWMLLEKSKDSEITLKESRKSQEEQLVKAANFIVSKDQESATKLEQTSDGAFTKIFVSLSDNKTAQEKTDLLIESNILAISQKMDEIKGAQLKSHQKIFIFCCLLGTCQLITLALLAYMMMKPL